MSLKPFIGLLFLGLLLAPVTGIAKGTTDASATNKDQFVESIERQVDVMENRIDELKRQRDGLDRGTALRRDLEVKIHAMEAKLKEANDNLTAMKKAPDNAWANYQARINENMRELQSLSDKKLAE